MYDVTLYLMANPLIATGLGLLALLTIYNVLRGQTRVALGMWLVFVAALFYVWVQVSSDREGIDDAELVEPPQEQSP